MPTSKNVKTNLQTVKIIFKEFFNIQWELKISREITIEPSYDKVYVEFS